MPAKPVETAAAAARGFEMEILVIIFWKNFFFAVVDFNSLGGV